jgi:acyl-CoA thioester hydrolase
VTERIQPDRRADYRHFDSISTRWMDNDAYLHVNNVVYYSFFDTAVTRLLIHRGGLDPAASPAVGLVVESQCRYFSSIAFPDIVHAGLRVGHLGTSSVRYELALFRNDEDLAAAQGHFVHVYVDRVTNRPTPIGESLRQMLDGLRHAQR